MINTIALYAASWAMSLRDTIIEAIKPEDGQDIMEYAVLAGGIALAIGVLLFAAEFTGALDTFTGAINDCLSFSPECGIIE